MPSPQKKPFVGHPFPSTCIGVLHNQLLKHPMEIYTQNWGNVPNQRGPWTWPAKNSDSSWCQGPCAGPGRTQGMTSCAPHPQPNSPQLLGSSQHRGYNQQTDLIVRKSNTQEESFILGLKHYSVVETEWEIALGDKRGESERQTKISWDSWQGWDQTKEFTGPVFHCGRADLWNHQREVWRKKGVSLVTLALLPTSSIN